MSSLDLHCSVVWSIATQGYSTLQTMASVTEESSFEFYLILIYLHLHLKSEAV